MTTSRPVVVVLSGGLDSTVTLALAVARHGADQVRALGADYGQRHVRELRAAQVVAAHYGIPYETCDLRGLLTGSALLGEGEVPHGHYAAPSMEQTVVHGRNLLFASVAVSAAGPGGEVWLGVHSGDHYIYPDCRPSFWAPFSTAVRLAYKVSVVTPLILGSKTDAVRRGVAQGAPLHLTWSCYEGGELHCGQCGTCVERREAFAEARHPDPTDYAA